MLKHLKIKHNLTILPALEFLLGVRFFSPVTILAFAEVTKSFTLAMSVYSVLLLTQTALDIPLGVFSDHKGRRFAMIGGAFSMLASTLCYALAFSSAHGLWWLYGGGALLGLANAFFSGSQDALVYETLAYYRRQNEVASFLGRVASIGQLSYSLTGLGTMLLLKLGSTFENLMYRCGLRRFIGRSSMRSALSVFSFRVKLCGVLANFVYSFLRTHCQKPSALWPIFFPLRFHPFF
jgi:MFS family permease